MIEEGRSAVAWKRRVPELQKNRPRLTVNDEVDTRNLIYR
jgi:hypothetical protein